MPPQLSASLFFSDSTKAVTNSKQKGIYQTVTKPVQTSIIQTFDNRKQTRRDDKKAVLLPPSSFTLPSRSKGYSPQDSLPEGVVVRNSNSTHPASTPRTSLDSQKLDASSPATSTSSRGSEEEDEREEMPSGLDGEGEMVGEGEDRDEGHSNEELWEEGFEPRKMKDEDEKGQLREEANLQNRITAMKNTLQEFQDLKATYK